MPFLSHIHFRRRTLLALFLLALVVVPLLPIGVDRAHAVEFCFGFNLEQCANNFLSATAAMVLQLMSWILWAAGLTLKLVVNTTIIGMRNLVAPLLEQNGAISIAWQAIRNLANALFIFTILYIAISTILKANTHAMRQMLVRLIIAALLINFSLFFSKAIIDASNVVAVGFYKLYQDKNGQPVTLDAAIMNPLQIVTLYGSPATQDQAEALRKALGNQQLVVMMIVGSIFILISALVFFVIAVLLAVRFALLMLLMVFSPIGFVGMIVPQWSSWGRQYWSTLLNQAFFAPVFFILMYVVIRIINSPTYFRGILGNPPEGSTSPSFLQSLSQGSEAAVHLVLSFVVTIVMVLAALAIAKKMASQGSYGVTNFATRLAGGAALGTAGWLGRRSIGRVAHRVAESQWMQDRASASRFGGARLAQVGLRGVAKGSFDVRAVAPTIGGVDLGKAGGKGGYTDIFKKQVKEREDYAKSLGEGQVEVRETDEERAARLRGETMAARAAHEAARIQSQRPGASSDDRVAERQAARRLVTAEEEEARPTTRETTGISRQEAYARTSTGGVLNSMLMRRRVAQTAATKIGRAAETARLKRELPVLNRRHREREDERREAIRLGNTARVAELDGQIAQLDVDIERARSSDYATILERLETQGAAPAGGAAGGAAAGGGAVGGAAAGGGGGTTT